MSQRDEILQAYLNEEDIDTDIQLYSDTYLKFSRGFKAKVDTVYIQYEPDYEDYPHFVGYAHAPESGDYVSDWLDAEDFPDVDLSSYMDGCDIIDLQGLIEDHPEIFYS